jgi:hypothetical protein
VFWSCRQLALPIRQLFVTLVLSSIAAWDFRYTKKLETYPLKLFLMVESPADKVDERSWARLSAHATHER